MLIFRHFTDEIQRTSAWIDSCFANL